LYIQSGVGDEGIQRARHSKGNDYSEIEISEGLHDCHHIHNREQLRQCKQFNQLQI
jgi:hypothetical protein